MSGSFHDEQDCAIYTHYVQVGALFGCDILMVKKLQLNSQGFRSGRRMYVCWTKVHRRTTRRRGPLMPFTALIRPEPRTSPQRGTY